VDQLDITHLDSAGRRVYWVFIADPMDEKRPVLPEGVIEYCPYYGDTYRSLNPDKKEFPPEKEFWRIGNWLCDKPYFKVEGNFVRLADPLRTWLEEVNYSYVIDHRWTLGRFGWYVGLHNKKAAAHFKLVHGK
jgi:hypothetical protein